MTSRWFAGLTIFALGFGCAQMMRVTAANAAEDDGFRIVDHGNRYEITNTGDRRMLALVEYKEGMPAPEQPEIGAVEGSLTVMKYGLSKVRLARLEDMELSERECNPIFEDCVEPGAPFPSPGPGPRPKRVQGYVVHTADIVDW